MAEFGHNAYGIQFALPGPRCTEWLEAQLMDGPVRRDVILKRGEAARYGDHQLNLAKRALGVIQLSSPAGPVWSLPD